MQEPPYDRALALAAQVRSMRDHYLEVRCGCGSRRVIGLGRMAEDRRMATATLAHIALRIAGQGCHTGPDEVHLCATIHGLKSPAVGGGGIAWTLALIERGRQPSYYRRHPPATANPGRPAAVDAGVPNRSAQQETQDAGSGYEAAGNPAGDAGGRTRPAGPAARGADPD